MIVVAVLNEKGGVGKTTLSTHIARALQLDGENVLLVDSDPQGSARDWHAMSGEGSDLPPLVALDRAALLADVKRIGKSYSWVVIDGAPQASDLSIAAIKNADIVLIPVQPSPYDIWAADSLVQTVKARQEIANGQPKAAFIISRQIAGTKIAGEARHALEGYGLPIFESATCQRVSYANTASTGKTVLDLPSDVAAIQEIRALIAELKRYASQ